LAWVLWQLFAPSTNDLAALVLSAAAFLLVGIPLLLRKHPSAHNLGLKWNYTTRPERVVYVSGSVLLAALIASTAFFDGDVLASNIYSALFVPAFEELLFRGYCWSRLGEGMNAKSNNLMTWGAITVLFGLWHIGYADSVLRAPALSTIGAAHLGFILLMKVLVGWIVGFLAGFARWRTGKVYGAILIHALWNFFGR
jgi:membrane protease YdiL (CAAX protease family)